MKLFLAMLLAACLNAQEMYLCDAPLRIGMAKSEALTALKRNCELRPSLGADAWALTAKGQPASLYDDEIQFAYDTVISLYHWIETANGDAALSVTNKLYAILRDAQGSGVHVTVHPQMETEQNGVRHRSLMFDVGVFQYRLIWRESVGPAKEPISRIELTKSALWSSELKKKLEGPK